MEGWRHLCFSVALLLPSSFWPPASSVLIFSAPSQLWLPFIWFSRALIQGHGLLKPSAPLRMVSVAQFYNPGAWLAQLIFHPMSMSLTVHRWAALQSDANPWVQLAVVRRQNQLRIENYELGNISFIGTLGMQMRICISNMMVKWKQQIMNW